jgi:hypothetical protein
MSDDLDRMEEERDFLEGFRLPTELELNDEAKVAATPQSIDTSVQWELHRDELVKVRHVERELEMTVEMFVDQLEMIQFCADVELYGLYEAVLMLPKTPREKVMQDVITDMKLKAFPKRPLTSMKPSGAIVPTKHNGMRPESIWTLQKHEIDVKPFDRRAEQIFERALPAHKSQQFINVAKAKTVWHGVVEAPIEYREKLAARLLEYYGVKAPVSTPNQKRFIREGPAPKRGDRVLVIDVAGIE